MSDKQRSKSIEQKKNQQLQSLYQKFIKVKKLNHAKSINQLHIENTNFADDVKFSHFIEMLNKSARFYQTDKITSVDKKMKQIVDVLIVWNSNIISSKLSQILESFQGSQSLEMISIVDNKSSLKSNVVISLGEMIKSLGKGKKKEAEKNWKTST